MSNAIFEEFTKYPHKILHEFGLPESHEKFLVDVGLPTWCAPNMHFGELGDERVFLPIIRVGVGYIGLGEDKNDNPIALHKNQYSVWVLSKTNLPTYMASDVLELSEALYNFQICINTAVEINSEAYTGNNIPRKILDVFVSWANDKNALLLQKGSFWHRQLQEFGHA